MKKLGPSCFKEPGALELTRLRIKARRKRRLTYDCLGAMVQGKRVTCRKGHKFKGVLSLLALLRGRSSSVCQNCEDYDGETDE